MVKRKLLYCKKCCNYRHTTLINIRLDVKEEPLDFGVVIQEEEAPKEHHHVFTEQTQHIGKFSHIFRLEEIRHLKKTDPHKIAQAHDGE